MYLTLYNLIGYLLLPFALLRLLFKGLKSPAYSQRISERLGFIKPIDASCVWVHCVSVGEFRAAIALIDALVKIYPNHKILVTTTTPTASKAVIQHYQNQVLHTYFPFDVAVIVKRIVKKIRPDLCLLLETEIWPNLIHILHKNNIPTLLVNARLSQQSLKKYQLFSSLSNKTLNKLSLIATQNQNSAQRFIELGANKEKVIVTGNIKFDQVLNVNQKLLENLRKLTKKPKIVVFASTHKDEEAIILKSYLKNPIDALMLIIPRHPERFNVVFELATKYNITVFKRSSNQVCENCQILIGDSMGEMMTYFALADIVFIGGSLVEIGGHNVLEPAALAKPIIFGPHVFNFGEISADLLAQNAAIQVQNADELMDNITHLLNNSDNAKTLGANAKRYLKSQQGAVATLTKQIKKVSR